MYYADKSNIKEKENDDIIVSYVCTDCMTISSDHNHRTFFLLGSWYNFIFDPLFVFVSARFHLLYSYQQLMVQSSVLALGEKKEGESPSIITPVSLASFFPVLSNSRQLCKPCTDRKESRLHCLSTGP